MQRIVCPNTESPTMVERLISDDAERLGNVQWWSLASQCTSDQLVKTVQCEAETKEGCAVSNVGHHERSGAANLSHARRCEKRNENCENVGARKMGSRVCRYVCWSSMAIEARSTRSGETWYLRQKQIKVSHP